MLTELTEHRLAWSLQHMSSARIFCHQVLAGFVFADSPSCGSPEQVLGGEANSRSGGRSSAHVGDPPQRVDDLLLVGHVMQAELHPLLVGELHGTWTAQGQVINSSTNQ